MRKRRFFVAGTDTGVGKTGAACALLSLMNDADERPFAFKPYESGCADERRPSDGLALQRAAGGHDALATVSLYRFQAALAPGVAAAQEGRRTSFARVVRHFRRFDGRSGVVEGAGGLCVPLDNKNEVIDLASALRLPVLLVARAGLGTLNHVALSLSQLRARRIPVAAVLLVQSQRGRDASVVSNPKWIVRRNAVRVLGPVPFCAHVGKRRLQFRRALAPLLDE
ncbi:MAG: dethiobiotin synthase [Myxococcaceae bacterium]